MPLGRRPRPFSHAAWLFEIQWDGFRSLVHVEHGKCKLISRNGNEFKSFPGLNDALASEFKARSAVLDGEIAVSYTHLDVYKRQVLPVAALKISSA